MKNFPQKNIMVVVLVLCGVVLGWSGYYFSQNNLEVFDESGQTMRARVIQVIDGDTVRISGGEKIRLLGIDSSEKGECYYEEAKNALEELIKDKIVRLDKDVSDRDRYDRLLRYIFLERDGQDNIFINDYLVRQGFAFDISSGDDSRYRDLLSTAEEIAKRENRGLWAKCNYSQKSKLGEENYEPSNPNCIIKGNISEKGYGKTYLMLGCDNYKTVKIDERKGEQYFCTEEEAVEAGFRKATNCP